MSIKLFLYILLIPTSIWVVSSLNIEKYFKKGRITQIKLFYLFLSFIISYLVVNFLYDFYEVSQLIK
jgi:uncharacterized integral membrane protein (TIGR02327 family)